MFLKIALVFNYSCKVSLHIIIQQRYSYRYLHTYFEYLLSTYETRQLKLASFTLVGRWPKRAPVAGPLPNDFLAKKKEILIVTYYYMYECWPADNLYLFKKQNSCAIINIIIVLSRYEPLKLAAFLQVGIYYGLWLYFYILL